MTGKTTGYIDSVSSQHVVVAGLPRATENIIGSVAFQYILTRKTPIGSATTGMRVMGKYVERAKQLCVNAI